MRKRLVKKISAINTLVLLLMLLAPLFSYQKAQAATFDNLYIRLDRLAAGTTSGTVCAKPGSAAEQTHDVQVVFPTGFTVNTTASNWTVTTTNLPSGTTAWTNITTASGVSGQTVTFAMTADATLATANTYCFNFAGTNTLTTASGNNQTGTVTTRNASAGTIDTGNYALSIVSSGEDLIVISATVPSTFSFALDDNVDSFPTLSPSTIESTTGEVLTISTNAANGWTAWVKSANAALDSAISGGTIPTPGSIDGSPSTLSAGTSGYVLDVNTGSGSPTIDGEYDGGANQGGTLSANFQRIAYTGGPGASNTVTLVEKAAISATQAAATDYTDTLTVVAAGMF